MFEKGKQYLLSYFIMQKNQKGEKREHASFTGTAFAFCLLSFGKLLVNQLSSIDRKCKKLITHV
jgi:hypothetical protein